MIVCVRIFEKESVLKWMNIISQILCRTITNISRMFSVHAQN